MTDAAGGTAQPIQDRLLELFRQLGVRRAHVAAGYAADAVSFASAYPERVSSLTLVCPFRLTAQPLVPFGPRLLFFHGDHGPNAGTVPRAAALLPGARAITLKDYADAAWSDVIADRELDIEAPMLEFLAELQQQAAAEFERPSEPAAAAGEIAGVTYRIAGSGPPLILLPINLARSQWEPLLPVLRERYTTIELGGAYIGFVLSLQQRIQGAYQGVVRWVFEQTDVKPGESILEVGCGPGAVARALAGWTGGVNAIHAVDVNSYLLREAQALTEAAGLDGQVAFGPGDAETLPFAAERFDVCLSFTVMEEVDAERMLAEMIRVTRPGGRVGVVVRAVDMLPWLNLPLRPELRALIEAAPTAGADPRGCADASLYRRFATSGLTDLRMGPRLAANQSDSSNELLASFSNRILQSLPVEAAEEFRLAIERAVDDGTMIWAEAYHCAVGTKPRA